jgi:molybdenum cofactor cytidylyltransferase
MSNCDEPPDPEMPDPDTQDSDAQDLDTQDSDAQDSDAQGSETYSSSTHDLNQFEKNASSERQRDRTAAPQFVINPNPAQGKTGSILTGLRAVPASISTLAISAVDQPRPAWIYQTLLQAHQQQQALITVPTHCDRTGHPALFHTSLRPRLRQIRDETLGLRAVMQEFHSQIQRIEIHHAVVLTDLNTPDAYTAAFNQEVYSNPA